MDIVLGEPHSDDSLVAEGIGRDENFGGDEDRSSTSAHDQHTGWLAIGRCPESRVPETRVVLLHGLRCYLASPDD
jgi:hypothetical protein